MGKRKRIALVYRVSYDFSAGIVIYIQNILKSLNMLEDQLKPHVTIIHSKDSPIEEIAAIGYPYLDYYLYQPLPSNLITKSLNKISRMISGKNIVRRYSFPNECDIIYPFPDCLETYHIQKRVYWKPDFQEMYYPQFLNTIEYNYSMVTMKNIARNPDYTLVLSSEDSYNDFVKFFGPHVNKFKILKFISILPAASTLDANMVFKKYGIRKPYFLVSNQFWPHKNHQLVIDAIAKLKSEVEDFMVVFTGKQSSYRDSGYFSKLKESVESSGITEKVNFTGFIPRDEQLVMMKNSMAVIQPSLFEGWSTIIEDCKAINQRVIAADLNVNQEQIKTNCVFFNRHSAEELAAIMKSYLHNPPPVIELDYQVNKDTFIKDLIQLFNLNRQTE